MKLTYAMASKIHKVRFYNPAPQAINCTSFNKKLSWLALARADASIEIWDLKKSPYLVIFIPGVKDGSVEALGWVDGRLLSTGLGGALLEWDLTKLCPRTTMLLTGSAAWSIDVDSANTMVAVGTEQGFLNLYSVENDEIVYKKLFDKQEGRIISCKFNKSGKMLVTGSINTIRIWNVETGHATNKLTVSCKAKNEVIVWSVAVLSDDVVVSGDSMGRLTFWDGNLGEQIESFSTHKADILSVTVSDDENAIYCAGIDPTITNFVKVNRGKGTNEMQWVKNFQRHIHEHDVRALVLNDQMLISVGVDGYLTFSSFPPKWVMRLPPMIPLPRTFVCQKKRLLLLRYSNHLEVWKLGTYATNAKGDVSISNHIIEKEKSNDNQDKEHQNNDKIEQDSTVVPANGHREENQRLELTDKPLKFVTINAKKNKQILCCAMSPSGDFIVYSTDKEIRLLKLETDDIDEEQTNISVSKVEINGVSSIVQHIAFTEDSRTMIVQTAGQLLVLRVDPEAEATVVQAITLDKHLKSPSVLHLLVSKSCKSGATYIAVADTMGGITVLAEKKNKFSHHITLPKYHVIPTALTFDVKRETLITAYSDLSVLEYDLVNKKFTQLTFQLPPDWFTKRPAITGISTHPKRDAIVFTNETSMWVLDRPTSQSSNQSEPQTKKKSKQGAPQQFCGIKVLPMKYLSGFHWVGEDEAVLVETLPEHIVSQLPAPAQLNHWHIRPERI